jgi:hypothetical protein
MYRTVVVFLIPLVAITVLLLAGCGYNPEDPAYDTTANPDNFPQKALTLLDDVESGSLTAYDSITSRFADLYTESSDLLDNQAWKDVIDRVGSKFQYRADQAVENGIGSYTEAASMYLLASFAHPEDTRLAERSSLFSVWTDVAGAEEISSLTGSEALLADQLGFLRKFELADSLHRQFSKQYLRRRLLMPEAGGRLEESSITALEPADRAFLSYLGLTHVEIDASQASFEDPSIDLVTSRMVPQGNGWYLVEIYFLPHQEVPKDYTVALRVFTSDSTLPQIGEGILSFIPFDFEPHRPTSQWRPGEIFAAAKRIYYEGPTTELKLGLYDRSANPSTFLTVTGSDDRLIPLPVTDVPVDR